MRTDIMIDIVVLAEKASGTSQIVYVSNFVAADQTMDLFVSEVERSIALYHHDESNELLCNAECGKGKMTYPGRPTESMFYVGKLRGTLVVDRQSHLEINRAQLHLKGIPVDEY